MPLFFCRACVGRNLAVLELQIIVASIMRRYDIVLRAGEKVSRNRFQCTPKIHFYSLRLGKGSFESR